VKEFAVAFLLTWLAICLTVIAACQVVQTRQGVVALQVYHAPH
jgi:hypothetical protein